MDRVLDTSTGALSGLWWPLVKSRSSKVTKSKKIEFGWCDTCFQVRFWYRMPKWTQSTFCAAQIGKWPSQKCRNLFESLKKWLFNIHNGKNRPFFQDIDLKFSTFIHWHSMVLLIHGTYSFTYRVSLKGRPSKIFVLLFYCTCDYFDFSRIEETHLGTLKNDTFVSICGQKKRRRFP